MLRIRAEMRGEAMEKQGYERRGRTMDHKSILFDTKSDASVTIEHMKYIAGTYIYASVADLLAFYRPYSIGDFADIKHGWDYDALKTLKPEQVENGQWRIPFPEPVEITFDAKPGTVIVDMY